MDTLRVPLYRDERRLLRREKANAMSAGVNGLILQEYDSQEDYIYGTIEASTDVVLYTQITLHSNLCFWSGKQCIHTSRMSI